ncbi:MAG: hypothetical protein KJZ83_21065, partial [Burkholderiaceae bacterium]|nr:hypothetical protein [Burkholderiaceae bacterium]
LRSLNGAERRGVVALRRRYEDVLARILADGTRERCFSVPEPRITAFAILAMLTGVGAWYNESGRLAKRELIDLHTQLVMQCVGARVAPPRNRAARTGAMAG